MKRFFPCLLALLLGSIPVWSQINAARYFPPKGVPRDIIIIIGNGMGLPQLSAAMIANKGSLNIEQFPVLGFIKPFSKDNVNGTPTDAALMFSRGLLPGEGSERKKKKGEEPKPNLSLFEWAKKKNMATGLVVTGAVTDPEVAPFYTSSSDTAREKLAVELLNSNVDLMMGGGRKYFIMRSDKRNLEQEFVAKGYALEEKIKRAGKVSALKSLALMGDEGLYKASLRKDYLTNGSMAAALALKQNMRGYILVVEASQIKWGMDAGSSGYAVDEVLDLDKAVGNLNKVFSQPANETLILFMGDQQSGDMNIQSGNIKEGKYDATWCGKGPNGNLIPVFASGTGAEQFSGFMDRSRIYEKIVGFLEIRP